MGEKRKIFEKFCFNAGRLSSVEVWDIGIEDNDFGGDFAVEKIPMLFQFCKDNPEFHIMSDKDGCIYNQFVEGAKHYFLANGDPTPGSAEINTDFTAEELLELEQSKAFKEFRKAQRGRGVPTLAELYPKKTCN